MNRIKQEGDVITIRVGGPDEWAASNAIRDAYIEKWQAEAKEAARVETERVEIEPIATTRPTADRT